MLAEEIAREEWKLHLYKMEERKLKGTEISLINHPQPLAFWQSTTSTDEQLQKVRTTLREYRTLIQESENRLAELRRRNIFGYFLQNLLVLLSLFWVNCVVSCICVRCCRN